jgi:hypothetical protein
MAIVAADLIGYNAANKPQDDTSTGGGGRDVDNRFDLIQLAANDTLEMVSSAAGDTTQGVTVFGRDAAGAELSDTQTVNGTSVVAFTGTFERIISVLMDADAVGIVTVRRSSSGPTVYAIPIGERGASALFIKSASAVGAVTRYDKIFWENAHATLTLTAATVELTADPDSRIRIGVHTSKNDTATITNRLTAPGGITFVDDSVTQAVPGNTLEALSDIGVWIEQALLAADAPFNSSFTTELAGTST